MSWWGRTVNRVSNSVRKFRKDPKRMLAAAGTLGASELVRGTQHSAKGALGDIVNDPKRLALAVGTVGMSEGVRALKGKDPGGPRIDQNARNQVSDLLASQMKNAAQFEEELPQYIEAEYGDRARGIKQTSEDAKKSIQGTLNSRGMLHSGLRQAKEGRLGAETGGLLQSARGDVTRDALMRAQAMKTDPALSAEAGIQQSQNQLANLDAIKAQRDAFRNQMMGSAFSGIGTGLGAGMADSSKFKRT